MLTRSDPFVNSRRRKGSHSGKGLRHFSMKVCEKVQRKQITSYNEVADELVNEIFDPATGEVGFETRSYAYFVLFLIYSEMYFSYFYYVVIFIFSNNQ